MLNLGKQKVTGYVPPKDAPRGDTSQAKIAFKDADIIVIPAGIPRTYIKLRHTNRH